MDDARPACDVSQPICVPVSFRVSRRNSREDAVLDLPRRLPFTVMVTLVTPPEPFTVEDQKEDDREHDQPPDIGTTEKPLPA